ncbi:MAG: LPS export ABC transporter ATP-binding protein [Candidatus Omnitrophica bacterium]|nr:LPS export ABC transporter ATP-binding protein [Candidatus Omnitrophota bacterium]MCM8828331.1 LPS export ABC transporter ATP-binding protein [Candidatus Omnitrophota bacterium]
MLEIKNIAKKLGGKQVLKDVSLYLGKNEITGLLGPNGAGKTTTFNIIMGFIIPDSGRVYLNGNDITNFPVYKRARSGMSYLFQEPAIFSRLTVIENLLIILENFIKEPEKQIETAKGLLNKMGIEHLSNRVAGTLSGGEKRRLEMARNLINNPEFLLLDEPFSGIDPKTVSEIKAMILELKNQNVGILITDHNVRDALSITDRAYLIYNGSILIEGTPSEILNDYKSRQVYFGEEFRL